MGKADLLKRELVVRFWERRGRHCALEKLCRMRRGLLNVFAMARKDASPNIRLLRNSFSNALCQSAIKCQYNRKTPFKYNTIS